MLSGRLKASPMRDHLRGQLDRLRCGMVFCNAKGRVRWLNRSAESLLADGPLRLVGSRLRGETEADTDELLNELAGSAMGNSPSYLCLGQGKWALHLAIQASAHPATMVLTLTSPGRSADIPADALIRLFDVTPAEASLMAALATGSTLEHYAQERGVSISTVRVQLKSINEKTGARRQSELVRLVWSSAVAHLSPPQP
jgi:DNA-binding CsgD family transcriptional regulator